MPSKQKALTECPVCGYGDIFYEDGSKDSSGGNVVWRNPYNANNVWHTGKLKAYCPPQSGYHITNQCKQKFWYYPKTGRITRRKE